MYLSDNIKKLAVFKINSKWVFQEENSMVTDTVTVIESTPTTSCETRDNDTDCEEKHIMKYFSSYNNYTYTDHIAPYANSNNGMIYSEIAGFSNLILATDQGYIDYINQFTHNLTSSSLQHLNSISINGILYYEVLKFHVDNKKISGSSDYKAHEYYFAKNYGIIKKTFYDSTSVKSWILIHKELYQ